MSIFNYVKISILGILLASSLAGCNSGNNSSGSSTPSVAASDLMGTWKAVSNTPPGGTQQDLSPYNITLVVDASTYTTVHPVNIPGGQNACTEYGTWTVSGNNLTITPMAGSTCVSPASTQTISISGTSVSLSAADGTTVFQKQPANAVTSSSLVGTWNVMADKKGTTPLSTSSGTLSIDASSYSFSGSCSEIGGWSVSGNTLTLTPNASGTCGNATAYPETLSLNGPLLTQTDPTEVSIYEKQAGTTASSPSLPAASGTGGAVSIGWQAVNGATSYNVYRSTSSGALSTKTVVGSVASGTTTTYVDASAAVGTTYYYQVTSVSGNGESAPSVEVSSTATASAPSPVTNLAATAGNAQATLSWTAVSGATSYNIYIRHTSAGTTVVYLAKDLSTTPSSYPTNYWTKISGYSFTSSPQTFINMTNGDTYQFMVTAVNAYGEGLSTSYVQVVPAASGPGQWTASSSLGTDREYHTATLLANGNVLVTGGWNGNYLSSTELYNPAVNSWTAAASLDTPREEHTATLLSSGKVLVVGGESASGVHLASTRLYDPATNTWSAAASLTMARLDHTATLLSSGKVLVVGGWGSTNAPSTAELYDPSTTTWSSAGNLVTARHNGHTATLLANGKVLVAGGSTATTSAELYDPTTNTWSSAGSLPTQHCNHTATLLPNGKVMVAGGSPIGPAPFSAEIYDPATNSWSTAASLAVDRWNHSATLLPNGKVLVAGGVEDYSIGGIADAALYDSATNTWSTTSGLISGRYRHTATLLPSGKVLVTGGNSDAYTLSATELYW